MLLRRYPEGFTLWFGLAMIAYCPIGRDTGHVFFFRRAVIMLAWRFAIRIGELR